MSERIVGDMALVDVRIETYDLRFEESEEQVKEYRADPAGFMRRFLEQQGHKVNRIQFIRAKDRPDGGRLDAGGNGPVEQRMPDRNYHIVYPGNEASGWICCCA